tara:strand:- start:934 stop:1362 length:429 start_codon:yes stop_codon:yes gene_type:complete
MILKCDKFVNLGGDQRFNSWLDEVRQLEWEGYELWLCGGLLHKTITRDLDASLVGPWEPDKIRYLLNNMYQIAFKLQIEPDIKYHSKDNLIQPGSSKRFWSAYPPGMLFVGNEKLLCGKLGHGDLRWKEANVKPIAAPKKLI